MYKNCSYILQNSTYLLHIFRRRALWTFVWFHVFIVLPLKFFENFYKNCAQIFTDGKSCLKIFLLKPKMLTNFMKMYKKLFIIFDFFKNLRFIKSIISLKCCTFFAKIVHKLYKSKCLGLPSNLHPHHNFSHIITLKGA